MPSTTTKILRMPQRQPPQMIGPPDECAAGAANRKNLAQLWALEIEVIDYLHNIKALEETLLGRLAELEARKERRRNHAIN
jgi:hypothetical protein